MFFKRKCQWTLPPSKISAAISLRVRALEKNKKTIAHWLPCFDSELSFYAKIIFFVFQECQWTLPPSEISAAISLRVKALEKNKKTIAHSFPCFSVRTFLLIIFVFQEEVSVNTPSFWNFCSNFLEGKSIRKKQKNNSALISLF